MLFLIAHWFEYLDAEFDAIDIEADRELCRGIMAGRMGLHPDAWGNHGLLTTRPPHHRKPWVPPVGYPGGPEVEWKPHKPKPRPKPKHKHKPRPPWVAPADRFPPPPPPTGTLQLTCDVCDRARFGGTLNYYGDRPVKVAEIRARGHQQGWTCIAGTDRCPKCSQALDQGGDRDREGEQSNSGGKVEGHSQVSAPKPVGNGAGGDQGHKQHR